ncbi:hypothetical protein LTR37_013677 [Vermiconidia calcicola]|uniref:Uncharacterized protein n=1 Tax=Vermiconidia calcicola TaxID=1690605 RepID=A0ACC3MWA8_9PEZI|nr:hypothetical protein LTR37_013677 [Vermiconidia calcicola]
MSDAATKRRREKYSRLICLGCRARRIRCVLPDTNISPSPQPQPPETACQRCAQNGLDCIVDYTTLGRPSQKRNRSDYSSGQHSNVDPSVAQRADTNFEDDVSNDVEHFLLSYPETNGGVAGTADAQRLQPTKSERLEATFGVFSLLPALVARDKHFASSIGSQPMVTTSILEVVDEQASVLLDAHLVWHRLYYPNIPSLSVLREHLKSLERGQAGRTSTVFLLTLLYDLALDVPSLPLASLKKIQPAVRAFLYHSGQQVLFSLSRDRYTVLALILAAQYRPLALTSSQAAAAPALKAVPYALLAKQIATELGYDTAGPRLSQALHGFDTDKEGLAALMHDCINWIQLSSAHDTISAGPFEKTMQFRPTDQSTFECIDALNTASLLGRMPTEILLPYCSIAGLMHLLVVLNEITDQWHDLGRLGQAIQSHKAYINREAETLEHTLQVQGCPTELFNAISHLAGADRHFFHRGVVGYALFFAVMHGAFAASQRTIRPDQAMEISDHIIGTLTAHTGGDPNRPDHRKFLEEFGTNHIDEQERVLSNFITVADSLRLKDVPYIGPTRHLVSFILFTCKDIVEGQAARLKGWGK